MTAKLLQSLPLIPLWIAQILVVSSSLNAQQADSARIAGTVRSSVNGRPVAGVMIAVAGTQTFDVTDSSGAFALSGLPSGRQTVRILYRDEVFYEKEFGLKRGKTLQLEVLADVEAVQLAPVVVQAQSVRGVWSLAGFYERRKRGFGRFYTFEELQGRGPLSIRALLGESGIQERCRRGHCVPVVQRGGRLCVPTVYVDGWPSPTEDLSFFRADDLAALEIYKSGIDVPWELQRSPGRDCGAVVMWRRY